MIRNATHLEGALEHLATLQRMQEAMRVHLQRSDPSFFPIVSEGYTRRIEDLQEQIIAYLREKPAESSLSVRVAGPSMQAGVIKATVVGKLIAGLQSALYQVGKPDGSQSAEGKSQKIEGIRSVLGLNMVATSTGSFILAMELPGRHEPTLFEEHDIASLTLEQLIEHVNELRQSADVYTGDRPTLRGLQKVADLVKKEIETIEVVYHDERRHAETVFDPSVRQRIEYLLDAPREGERTIRGKLIEINVENRTCKVHPEDAAAVTCDYEESLEDDLIAGLKRSIEMAGQFKESPISSSIRITKIERFRILDVEDTDAS